MLFDTTFLIDLQRELRRKRPGKARDFLLKHSEIPLQTSVVCAMEFAEGYESHEQSLFSRFLEPFRILPLPVEIAWKAGQIRRALRSQGRPVGDNDLLIAATALHHGLPLVTRNRNHFEGIGELEVLGY